jgi:hypothetical protein
MATGTTTYEDVKNHSALEHVDTRDDGSTHDEKVQLEQKKTLSEIDVENKAAYKGDDSDGSVDWSWRNIVASIFLCMLYTVRPLSFQSQPH